MKKLLLITGDLACGKSAFAAMLSDRYGAHVFRKDDIKETLCDSIGFADRAENRRLSVAAVELMRRTFDEFARLGDDLLLEANFRENELNALHKAAAENRYDVLTLVLRADIPILFARFMNRMENEGRHPAHLSAGLTDPEAFADYIETQRRESVPGSVIEICADDFSYKSDSALLEKIDRFMLGDGGVWNTPT